MVLFYRVASDEGSPKRRLNRSDIKLGRTQMSWFKILFVTTVVVRGVGAGIIFDVAIIGLDTRREIGVVPYARFARALFARRGRIVFVPVAIGGALLTTITAV